MPAAHHNLTIPEHKTLRADAERQVKDELGAIARPDDRFKRACEIVQQADLEIAAHAEERNQAAMSLWFYDGVRGLDKVLGILPNAYNEMRRVALHGDKKATINPDGDLNARMTPEERRAAATRAGVEHIEDAADRLPSLSATVSVAGARRKAAMPFLYDATLALTEEPYGWSTTKIAEMGDDLTPAYVRNLKTRAKKRRGY
ncbi:hypothetical protein [Streptomyces sp. NBC_00455]|uniref:hypothetical protein n=1 Tax=Streptomyces sp. NBC_00455 TaxID=2903654 RepID=UPI002E221E61